MSDDNIELQSDEYEFVPHDDASTESAEAADADTGVDQPSESAPDSDTEHEGKDGAELEGVNAKVSEKIGEITRKRREAEREAEQLRAEKLELTRQLLIRAEPVVPDLPDQDEVSEAEYAAAVAKRDQAIRDKVKWAAEKQALDQTLAAAQQSAEQAKQEQLRQDAKRYEERAAKFKVSPQELQAAAAVIGKVGIAPEVAAHILADESGPLITRYLGANIDELVEVSGMPPLRAALYIEKNIKPKLGRLVKKSKTPAPLQKKGVATASGKSRYPLTEGRVKFE